MIEIEFDSDELKVLARLVYNLYSASVEAELDPGLLEPLYFKLLEHIEED